MLTGNVLVTGGTGTLGKAFIRRAHAEGWPCRLTVYSRDEIKQFALKREFPGVRMVVGDVADYDTLERCVIGHDTIVHMAAFKHIPAGELNVNAMLQSNLVGSQNVAMAALRHGVERVLGISTDKVCHAVNAYGMSKALMERVFQEANAAGVTAFHLVRYGNVLDSTGSVIPRWQQQLDRGEPLTLTDPQMTRFWLSVDRAVDLVVAAFDQPPGTILVPALPGLAMGRFAEYVFPGAPTKVTGLRPGEKTHEELLTREEGRFARRVNITSNEHFVIHPVWGEPVREIPLAPYTSDRARELDRGELLGMLRLAEPIKLNLELRESVVA